MGILHERLINEINRTTKTTSVIIDVTRNVRPVHNSKLGTIKVISVGLYTYIIYIYIRDTRYSMSIRIYIYVNQSELRKGQ